MWKERKKLIKQMYDISGKYTGLLKDTNNYTWGDNVNSKLNIMYASFPNYERLITSGVKANYHLSGYGSNVKDAMPRLLGESIERFAVLLSYKYLDKKIFKDEYQNIEIVKPNLKFLNAYSENQLKKLSKLGYYSNENLKKDSKIHWMKATSLYDSSINVAVPANNFFVGFMKDKGNCLSVSTGTATYTSFDKALSNSLIEYIQIDAFMKKWYSDEKIETVYLQNFPKKIREEINDILGNLKNRYDVLLMDFSNCAQANIYVYGIFLISKTGKDIPAISFGLQGGIKRDETIIRGFFEALANREMFAKKFCVNPQFTDIDTESMIDLDSNVDYYANPINFTRNFNFIKSRIDVIKDLKIINTTKSLIDIIKELKKIAPSACFLDITPPFLSRDYRVCRVYIPELMSITFPSFPPIMHPNFIGKKSEKYYIHPMP